MALKDSRRKKTTSSIAKSLAENFDYEDALSRERVQNLAKMEKDKNIFNIQVEKLISNPFQDNDETNRASLHFLKQSLKENGQITPIVVSENEDGMYTIIAGHRRVEAFKELNKEGYAAFGSISAVLLDSNYMKDSSQENRNASAVLEDNLYNAAPTFEMIVSNIELILDNVKTLSREEYENIMGISQGDKKRFKINKAEFVYKSLEPLNIQNWTYSSVKRYIKIIENGIDSVKTAFFEKKIPLESAAEISYIDKEKQAELLDIYNKYGRDELLLRIQQIRHAYKSDEDLIEKQTEKSIKKITKSFNDINSSIKEILKNKDSISQKDKEIIFSYKKQLKEVLDSLDEL